MTRTGMVLGTIGGLGAGWILATSTPLMLDFLGLGLLPDGRPGRSLDYIPVLLIAAAALTAMFAGRFGWVVSGAGAVLVYALGEIDLSRPTTELRVTALFGARSVADGVVLGGALAAFAAASRHGRRAIAAGLAAGTVGGVYLLFALPQASARGYFEPQLARILTHTPVALCVVAGIGSLVLVLRRRDTSAETSRADWLPPATSVVAATGAIVYVGLASVDASEALYVAAAVAIVIAAATAWRAGPAAAAWVIVGFAAGSATAVDELVMHQRAEASHFVAAAVGGVALGALLARFITKVPWEAIALVGGGAAILASQPPSLRDMALGLTPYPAGPVAAVALVGLALAVTLLRLGERAPQLGTATAAGFASFVVAGMLTGPISGFIFENPVRDRRGIAIGLAGLAVLALHLVSVARRDRAASNPRVDRQAEPTP